jgi:hypothetical protein
VNYVGRINCPGGAGGGADEEEAPPPPPSDGRLPGSGTEAVVYAEDDGIEIWAIDDNSQGTRVLFVSTEELASLPANPEQNTLIAATDDGQFALYKLTTGEYQINIGPDAEGKIRVMIFDAIPPTNVYGYDLQ